MKKIHFISSLTLVLFLFSSCFKDKGNYDYTEVGEIEISGIEENYTKVSFAGVILEIMPNIKTDYQDLEYEWSIWDRNKLENGMGNVKVEVEVIGTERNLAYEVNLTPSRYKLAYKVTSKSNGYSAIATADLEINSALSRGFYILKETQEGNTEVDLYTEDGEVLSDLLLSIGGKVMEGKPVCLSSIYGAGFVDPEDNEMKSTQAVAVTTDKGLFNMYNVADWSVIHTQDNIFYSSWPEGEIPYAMVTYGMGNMLISSRGCDMNYRCDMMTGSGCMSTSSGKGGSPFMMPNSADPEYDNYPRLYYWSNEEEYLEYINPTWMGYDFGPFDMNGFDTKGMECLACGSVWVTDPIYGYCILKEKNSDTRHMLIANLTDNMAEELRPIPADSKMAKASHYTTNVRTANLLYFVYNNQLYGYNLTDHTEAAQPYRLEGMGDGETITYLSYQWLQIDGDKEHNFTHLVVGTQKENTYKLYMYDIVAGEPRTLVRTIAGEGKLKMAMYMSPKVFVYNHDSFSLPN